MVEEPRADSLADSVGFELVGEGLGLDVESALRTALAGGVLFHNSNEPLAVFRQSLAASIRNIQTHPRGRLFQEFLLKGPYEGEGDVPPELRGQRLSDQETAAVITFIYSHMVNCFKGALAEMLASAPCLGLLRQFQQDGKLPENSRLYIGDAVGVNRADGRGLAKGADLHILLEDRRPASQASVTVAGVAEVKSYFPSERRLREQVAKHLQRARSGLWVGEVKYPPERVAVGYGKNHRVVRIAVLPDKWKLPRTFRFERTQTGRSLHVGPGTPPARDNHIARVGDDEWRITLRWSKEALASAAYEMTFWYMEKVGEVTYSQGVPRGWSEMTPAEAGRNAVKMMLYYAILRCRSVREHQRAIALYNTYGFGYALGMNFRNSEGKREMLWPEDLDELLASGKTKDGGRLVN